MNLTQKIVESLKDANGNPLKKLVSDDGCKGLYLQSRDGNASWVFKYRLAGRPRQMGLGPAGAKDEGRIPLETARGYAIEARLTLLKKQDPLDQRQEQKKAAAVVSVKVPTVREAAAAWIEARRVTWRSADHVAAVEASFKTYVFPTIGDTPVDQVTETNVADLLRPIWNKKVCTALRVQQRIYGTLKRAYRIHGIKLANPAELEAVQDILNRHTKQQRAKEHYPALLVADLPAFMAGLRARTSITARCLEFSILTAARPGEACDARFSEIEEAGVDPKTFLPIYIRRIPEERMKPGVEHVVTLSPRAVEIIEEMRTRRRNDSDFIFPSFKSNRPIGPMALLSFLKLVMGRKDITVHGFRRTFKSWTMMGGKYDREVAEQAMSHAIGNAVEQSYISEQMIDLRRRLMNDWADYCASATAGGDNVIPLRQAAAA